MTIGVDIGGTGLRAAWVERATLTRRRTASNDDRTVPGILACLDRLLGDLPPGPVGLAVPGFVVDGRVIASPNFPTWDHVPLASLATHRLGRPVAIANDADCAALGASRMLDAPDLLAVTLGTGVGGGRIVDGRLAKGRIPMELGHIWVGGDRRCGCGAIGCLETAAGATAVHRRAAALGLDGSPADWPPDHPVWRPFQVALAHGLRTVVNLTGAAEVVLLGGLAGPATGPAIARFRTEVLPLHRDLPIHVLGRADDAAILGAAALVDAR